MAKRAFQQYTSLLESGVKPSEQTAAGRVYRGVTVIKSGLGNRRDKNFYPSPVLKEAVDQGLFDGLKAFADHQTSVDEEIQPERSIRDIVGIYENARFEGESVRADLRILKAHKWLSDMVDELVELGHGDKLGISINGRGHTEPTRMKLEESGEEVEVNELKRFIDLRSADVVTEAGAGGGFQHLLESAREAKETNTMRTQDLVKALGEAAEAGDLDQVKALAHQFQEAEPIEEPEDPESEDSEDDVEEADAELEAAVEEAKAVSDALGAEDEEAECDDEVEDCPEEMAEAGMRIKKGHGIKGIGGNNTGVALKRNAPGRGKANPRKGFPGVKTVEVVADPEELMMEIAKLRSRNQKLINRNERLAEALRIRASADRARKLLKESGIPEEVRAHLLHRLIGKSEEEMASEIQFTRSLVESAIGRARAADDYEDVEGAGTRMRESYAPHEDNDLVGLIREAGLPTK